MSFLDLQGITASYGPTQALFGVDLALEEGEVRGADGAQRDGQDHRRSR